MLECRSTVPQAINYVNPASPPEDGTGVQEVKVEEVQETEDIPSNGNGVSDKVLE